MTNGPARSRRETAKTEPEKKKQRARGKARDEIYEGYATSTLSTGFATFRNYRADCRAGTGVPRVSEK